MIYLHLKVSLPTNIELFKKRNFFLWKSFDIWSGFVLWLFPNTSTLYGLNILTKLYVVEKREFLHCYPLLLRKHSQFLFSKDFNWYAQEIGQFRGFLFNFSWSQILISTGQRNSPAASDVHIKDTTSINTLLNFYSDGLNIFYKESEEYTPIFSRKSPTKNTHFSFPSIESIITTTYIPGNCAPQIGTNKETRDPVERHDDPLRKKKDLLRRNKRYQISTKITRSSNE